MPFNFAKYAVIMPMALSLAGLPSPTMAQPPARSAFDRAVLAQLDAPTRAAVEQRAVKGNTVTGVVGTMLLNNYYAAGARKPGEALTVVAVDFARGAVVFRRSANVFEMQRFNPQNLHIQR
ncbi:hypothetical protein WBP07_21215 (plasmid) [Novosphingobium sp. BL-8A]|uniref:hypothetical protein n=1 Tax=Novosphingobium sp. BL-8A TaxID=3127639 RepID=UPI003757EDB9